jgi:small-conductance mechanosensitive channel
MDIFKSLPSLDEITIPLLSDTEWAGNSVLRWLIAAGTLLGVALLARLIKALVAGRLHKLAEHTANKADDAGVKVLDGTAWYAYLALGLAVARQLVELSPGVNKILSATTFILLAIQVAIWCESILTVALARWATRNEDARTSTAAAATRFLGRLLIWSALTLVVLSNLGVEITTVVAGLGVGGVAAALAVQSILSDLFAGLSMYFDRPFDIGDFIIVGDVMGSVRQIGLRTTRLDSLGGEKIVYPNGELTKNFIRNYAWMQERRITFTFGIEYNVSPDVLDRARDIAREAVEHQSEVRFDRAHFKSFGGYSLEYEVVYYVLSGDYNLYMDKQHAINTEIYRKFAEEKIPFALSTRTLTFRDEQARA